MSDKRYLSLKVLQKTRERTVSTILRTPITLPRLIRTSPPTQEARLTEAETITQTSIVGCAARAAASVFGRDDIARDVSLGFASIRKIAFVSCGSHGGEMENESKEGDQRLRAHRWKGGTREKTVVKSWLRRRNFMLTVVGVAVLEYIVGASIICTCKVVILRGWDQLCA